ncbi:hypothetical protein V6N12_027044 [Hibiscus sabdariffa]|uniref:WRC domain-containing protein n=1 Tax=Hibiscus sabdariffa TaxID=183260 RepID=A0ABR2DTJ1_9ROSI
MRIRKRPVQQPFSWISPLSSDPNFNRSPVVQHPPRRQSPPPTDHPNHPIRRQQPIQDRESSTFPETTTTTIRATHGKEVKKKEDGLDMKRGVEDERGENGEEEKSNYTTRKKNVLGEEVGIGSLSHQGEKAFPLKKRRGGLGMVQKDDDDKSGKKGGSRCSRVNGRGWRCCQQTLVGYSLCEHHLGKGRLRSITGGGVKSRSNDNAAAMKKKDTKARSMSSLLGQNDTVIAVPDHDN